VFFLSKKLDSKIKLIYYILVAVSSLPRRVLTKLKGGIRMIIRPIGERVLVKPIKMEEKTASGLIIPGAADKDKPNLGIIEAVGSGEKLQEVKKGDKIVYARFSGTEIKDGSEKYIILNIENVLAVVD
jgi:chaperonin GroES